MLLTVSAAVALLGAAAAAAAPRRLTSLDARARSVLADVNALRQRQGLVPLRLSAGLAAAAREHSSEMARDGYFAHDSADGSPVYNRLVRYYPLAGHRVWSVGENLAWASPDLGATHTLHMWLRSPLHRQNLFAREWREIGIAAVHVASAPGMYAGAPVTIITADFGVRR